MTTPRIRISLCLLVLPLLGATFVSSQDDSAKPAQAATQTQDSLPVHIKPGDLLFQQHCAFCHGKDAAGGDTGPDLTRSKLVTSDKGGDSIIPLVQDGRLDKGMPRFSLATKDMTDLVLFLHYQAEQATKGRRRGVSDSDLTTGKAEKGRQFFQGAGGCTRCHSATGDLSQIASRHTPLELEIQMLYPKNTHSTVHLSFVDGAKSTGELLYMDEFVLIMRDDSKKDIHSYMRKGLHYSMEAPIDAHVAMLDRYTDDNIHDLLAYLLTMK